MTGYFGIITADVLHDKLLKPAEKLVYCELTASIGTGKFCIVDLQEYAALYDCTEQTMKGYLGSLEKRGYIRMSVTPKEKLRVDIK